MSPIRVMKNQSSTSSVTAGRRPNPPTLVPASSSSSKYRSNPPPGLHLGTIIHDSLPFSSETHSPDPLALSESETEPEIDIGRPGPSSYLSAGRTHVEPTAGPSSRPIMTAHGDVTGAVVTGNGAPTDAKGKGKAVERRVLPARIRRTAGGGAEGMRDVEEMVVDWLERWGEPSPTPPDNLPIHLTCIPLNLVSPPTTQADTRNQASTPAITLTPSRHKAERIDVDGENKLSKEERIETPSWVMVRPGEDDEEEAKEELEVLGYGKGVKGKGLTSPVKRLRRAAIGEELLEDTSDAYYHLLHRKYEVFERRQRIREKEKLQFERYKMRSRIDLLRNMSKFSWASTVGTILSRCPDEWIKGREKIKEVGVDWLRDRLVREGEEVMKRYEELLPAEQKKHKQTQSAQSGIESRLSTPSRASASMSLTPPPAILPARVAALRDTSTSSTKRKRRSSGAASGGQVEVDSPNQKTKAVDSSRASPSAPAKEPKTYGKGRSISKHKDDGVDGEREEESAMQENADQSSHRRGRSRPARSSQPSILPASNTKPATLISSAQPNSQPVSQSKSIPIPTRPLVIVETVEPRPALIPPVASTGVPCLIEAATRRELVQGESVISKQRSEISRIGKLIVREKTRASRRLEEVHPFGLPVPSVVESKSEFTLSDEEDFWPIIAGREENANRERRASLLRTGSATFGSIATSLPSVSVSGGNGVARPAPVSAAMTLTPEEVAEIEGVEEAVVL
ncbi:hypothetical protein IAR55_005117 [Kwoniella newhampshirensis]|uniref:Something about silencing protein 4 domain-containing protein n=1 Tax=Kwoniella newhampshirensis TaxID=1651941 RepID=A0AAW0YK15_9TREE